MGNSWVVVVGLLLAACGGSGSDAGESAGGGGSGGGGGGAQTTETSLLPSDSVVGELSEAELAAFCGWTTAQANAYQRTWTAERTCTFVGTVLAAKGASSDLAGARSQCAMHRDACLEDARDLTVLPCAALSSCSATVARVEEYYRAWGVTAEHLGTCDELSAGALDTIDLDATSLLPSCTLVGTVATSR
jgi:hypothetical protein